MKLTHEAVRDVLRTVGPMTSRELTSFFPGVPQRHVAAALSTMRTLAVQQVRICAWVREADYQRCYLRAVYELGTGRDAPKPPPLTNIERVRRYKAKRAIGRGVPASVWDWAAA
jgi:hypothetical protein